MTITVGLTSGKTVDVHGVYSSDFEKLDINAGFIVGYTDETKVRKRIISLRNVCFIDWDSGCQR